MGVRTRGTMRTPLGESGGLEEDRVNRVWTIGGYLVGRIDEWWAHFHASSDTTECGWVRGGASFVGPELQNERFKSRL